MAHKDIDKLIDHFGTYSKRLGAFGFSGQVLIAKGDDVRYNLALGYRNFEEHLPMAEDTVLSIGSISKQFTAALILRAADNGLLNVHDRIKEFFPEFNKKMKEITIHHLLTHSSGVHDVVDDFEYVPTSDFIRKVAEKGLKFNPGEQFSYSNMGYSLLAIILEKAYGKPYQKILMGLLNSVGIDMAGWFGDPKWTKNNSVSYYVEGERTGSIMEWPGSYERPYWGILGNGGVCLSASSLFKWMQALFKGEILSSESLDAMISPQMESYGYGWDIVETPLGTVVTHDGGSTLGVNADAMYLKDVDVTFIILSNVVFNGEGMAFQLRDSLQMQIEQNRLVLPPQAEIGKIGLTDLPFPSLKLGNINLIYCTSLEHINSIFQANETQKADFRKFNARLDTIGQTLVEKNRNEFFELYSSKPPDKSRLEFYKNLIAEFEKKYGELVKAFALCSLPFPPYYAITLLRLEGKKGRSGLPTVWKDNNTILGLRPMFTEYPLGVFVARNGDNIVGFIPKHNISLLVKSDGFHPLA